MSGARGGVRAYGALSLSLYIYIYIYMCVCVSVCVCMCVYARARFNNVHDSVRSSKADRGELLLVFERTGPESVPRRFCRPRPGYRRGTGGTVDARTCTRPPTGRDSVSRPRHRRGGRPWGAAAERAAR